MQDAGRYAACENPEWHDILQFNPAQIALVQPDPPRDELEVPARFAMIPATAAFAEAFCERNGIDRNVALRLRLVIEELFTNTISHGYRGECDAHVRIALALDDGELTLRYDDGAPEYDPREQWSSPPSSLAQPVGERPVGGLGVHLVGGLVSRAHYVREDERNRLWLVLRR